MKPRRVALLLCAIAPLFMDCDHATAQTQAPAAKPPQTVPGATSQQVNEKPGVLRETVTGGINFSPKDRMWTRISGTVKVVNAYTLVFEDGTEADLRGGMDAPELEQKGLIGDSFYPAGKEAAEFLNKLVANKTVTCYSYTFKAPIQTKKIHGPGYIGETNLEVEMVRNGWAISDHSLMDPCEIMARENKRGLWRGQFIAPERWRKGARLQGE